MLIEIVTHCYAGKLDLYWQALCCQLSAPILEPSRRCRVGFHVYTAPLGQDPVTESTVAEFKRQTATTWRLCDDDGRTRVGIDYWGLPLGELFRRSIGRNHAAKRTQADAVIFTDVDYVWTGAALDAIAEQVGTKIVAGVAAKEAMWFARRVKLSHDHATGMRQFARVERPGLVALDEADFYERQEDRAIGGNQIVLGDYCRAYGYLDGDPVFQSPADTTEVPFCNFRDDRKFRRQVGWRLGMDPRKGRHRQFANEFKGYPLELPGVYRLRHEVAGYAPGVVQTRKPPR